MKRRIAIICGGNSSEYDVSLRSAQGLYSFFDHDRYDVAIVVHRGRSFHVTIGDDTLPIDLNDFTYIYNGVRCGFDYAYITIHGAPGENGILQGYLDLIGMPYSTSSVLVEALTFDKYVLNNYLRGFGINVAPSILLLAGEARPTDEEIVHTLGLPLFVKPAADGSSFGISKVSTIDQLTPAITVAFQESSEVMIEAFIPGIEISQGAYYDGKSIIVLPATEVVTTNEFFDYDAKYNGQVEEITPARIPTTTADAVARTTRQIYTLLHCQGIIRVDYILTPAADGTHTINMLEVNTTPGMTATSFIPQQARAAHIPLAHLLTTIVEQAF